MAYDRKRCERLARAMASDTVVYMEKTIIQSFTDDDFFEKLADNMEENRKSLIARQGNEAAATNILECAVVDSIIYRLGKDGSYPIF